MGRSVHQWRRSYDVRPPRESEEQREAYLKIVAINILITYDALL